MAGSSLSSRNKLVPTLPVAPVTTTRMVASPFMPARFVPGVEATKPDDAAARRVAFWAGRFETLAGARASTTVASAGARF
ncbi:MAG: hypothetical protein ACR2KG_12480 [Nocardioidaceae bacterium]